MLFGELEIMAGCSGKHFKHLIPKNPSFFNQAILHCLQDSFLKWGSKRMLRLCFNDRKCLPQRNELIGAHFSNFEKQCSELLQQLAWIISETSKYCNKFFQGNIPRLVGSIFLIHNNTYSIYVNISDSQSMPSCQIENFL